ncbi:glycosyl hydrolase family 28-related protein, partial [Escherichia coli]
KDHGARGDGSADDTLAVKIALDRASSLESSSTLYFPSGVYRVSAGTLRVPDGHSTLIRGDGPGASRITFVEGETSSEPLVSLDALFSAVEDLQL